MAGFFTAITKRAASINSLLCVGLDPHKEDLEKLAEDASEFPAAAVKFCKGIVKATAEVALCYKPNFAFFEALGHPGIAALEEVLKHISGYGIPVILDHKVGDISSTAAAYARSCFERLKAGSVTVNPYMGQDSVSPFLAYEGCGVFVLAKTSNKTSNELQTLRLKSGEMLYEKVTRACLTWGSKDQLGFVVGATDVHALERVREIAPDRWILAPGIGFQGGKLEETLKIGLRTDGLGLLVSVSRGISRAPDPGAAARDFVSKIQAVQKKISAGAMQAHKQAFIEAAVECGALKFGSFKLKSGRISPYFFNAGAFDHGGAMRMLGQCYAAAIQAANLPVDVLFGPAYKGIPLVSCASMFLNCPFAYNRKERKDHGEGGMLVGAGVKGKSVVIIDDVITAGTAIREAIAILTKAGAKIGGVVVALDRQEIGNEGKGMSAVQLLEQKLKVPIINIVNLKDITDRLRADKDPEMSKHLISMETYAQTYGIKSSL